MLLLYHWRRPIKKRKQKNLHSTMLLLYQKLNIILGKIRKIYIPLCFYFIPWSAPTFLHPSWFTFHYASTLSHCGAADAEKYVRFTFHYASTLSRRTCWIRCVSSIYIPLCFYFIWLRQCCPCINFCIYIPLCFYFIWRFWFRRWSRKHIYIPLCFYFIKSFLYAKRRKL